MKVVCAWCKKVLANGDDEPVTHGICEKCKANVFLELESDEERGIENEDLRTTQTKSGSIHQILQG